MAMQCTLALKRPRRFVYVESGLFLWTGLHLGGPTSTHILEQKGEVCVAFPRGASRPDGILLRGFVDVSRRSLDFSGIPTFVFSMNTGHGELWNRHLECC
uniref:Uncharacterized protein n=1 Tax=Amorphochlora amoebiformis TaxID=1561963 RepID=A0A7S0DTD9_9EUKA|eukprot:1325616-Amorphochlora_amoeboformis.AAC.1